MRLFFVTLLAIALVLTSGPAAAKSNGGGGHKSHSSKGK